jgi:hypothetical protein
MAEQVKLLPSDAALRVAIRSAMGTVGDIYEDKLIESIGAIAPSTVKPDMVPRAELELVQFKLDAMYKVVQAYENLGK